MITVYSQPACVQCTATCRTLDKMDLTYEVIDLTQDLAAMALVQSWGHQRAPIVNFDGEVWDGYRPDLIKAAAARSAVA